ncbi:phosphotransferase [Rhizobium sp. YIM 134829]|uniref:phosphotransferase n=1 Tax=Rhizobium sp. YIM 134829 TaxID=3390453 RepID=UPI00397B80D0
MTRSHRVVKELSGHSGCLVSLCKAPDYYFVRKSAPNAVYGPRLMRQAEKQIRLAALIPTPKVIASEFSKVPFSYDMEFVQGLDFKQVCLSRPISWINEFVHALFMHLEVLNRTKKEGSLQSAFSSKISGLSDVIFDHSSSQVRDLASIVDRLAAYDFGSVPLTECHGDMTLENIIFRSDNTIVMIDLLDGELESVWMDIAKLVYDLEIAWSLRSSLWAGHHSPEERLLSMICRYLADEVSLAIENQFPEAKAHLPALKAIQALRVLPYSHNEQTINKLATYIAHLDF